MYAPVSVPRSIYLPTLISEVRFERLEAVGTIDQARKPDGDPEALEFACDGSWRDIGGEG